MTMRMVTMSVALAAGLATSAIAQDTATVGSGGSASAGGTSASTVGTAGASTNEDGDYAASIGSAGSAAAVDGKTDSRTKVKARDDKLNAHSRASAQDGGTFSKSWTKTKVKGGELTSRTKTMSHVPGQKPTIERSTSEETLGE